MINSAQHIVPGSAASLRRYCSHCGVKKYAAAMKQVYYKLLQKKAWHCQDCMSAIADNLHFISHHSFGDPQGASSPYLIELFSGSKTVSKTAEALGFNTFTIDIEQKFQPDLIADIQHLDLKFIPAADKIFVLWASLPCTFYSILTIQNHWEKIIYARRQYYYLPKTNEAKAAIKLLEKVLYIIRKINPVYFFLENPRGALRHMPQIKAIPFLHTVSYRNYGLNIYKPTDIFTNCPFLKLCKIETAVGKTFSESIISMKNAYQRSIVPALLIQSIISQIKNHHSI